MNPHRDQSDQPSDLSAIEFRLQRAGQEQREDLAQIPSTLPTAGEERSLAGFAQQMHADSRSGNGELARPSRVSMLPLAAAALLLIALGLWLERSNTPGGLAAPGTQVLGSSVVCLAPTGAVSSYDPFLWSFDLPPGGSYEIAVYDDKTGEPLLALKNLRQAKWSRREASQALSAASRSEAGPQTWPEFIRWEIVALDATGNEVGFGRSSAQLSSPSD